MDGQRTEGLEMSTEVKELTVVEELSFDENIIAIKQMPIIAQQLEAMKPKIEAMAAKALAMECTKENIQTAKKMCANLNNISKAFDKRRIQIKTQYMEPYDVMNQTFKLCITDPINEANKTLRLQINALETADKKKTEDEIKTYFADYAASRDVDIAYERVGINVTLSATTKSLKLQARDFIDKIAADKEAISQMDNSDEIMVEYNKTLDLAKSISTVNERHRLIEEANKRREEAAIAEAKRKEAAARVADAQAQQKRELARSVVVDQPVVITAPVVEKVPEKDPNEIVTVPLVNVTATRAKIRALKEYMIQEGIKYGR